MVLKSQEPEPEPGKGALAVTLSMEGMDGDQGNAVDQHIPEGAVTCPIVPSSVWAIKEQLQIHSSGLISDDLLGLILDCLLLCSPSVEKWFWRKAIYREQGWGCR